MISKIENFKIESQENDVIKLTDDVKAFVAESGITEGQCIVFTPHTTAGISHPEYLQIPWGPKRMLWSARLIPTKINFKHQHDTPQDAAGHVKSSLIGVTLALPIHEGKLVLGHSQGIYFLEFDGPRKREYFVSVLGE